MRQIDAILAGQTYEAFYLTINQELTLSFYVVDPEIDSSASLTSLAARNRQALERGLSIAYAMIDRISCVGHVFENVNPMIVDGLYQTWYIDVIPIGAFPEMDDPSPDELLAAMRRSGVDLTQGRRYPPRPQSTAAPAACTWPEARAAIEGLFGPGERNTAAYLLIDDLTAQDSWQSHTRPNVVVQAQWDIETAAEADDSAVVDGLGRLTEAVACLSPEVDQIEVFVVDQTGQLVVYGVVRGAFIQPGAYPLPSEAVFLHHTE
jgi:hypothetical protein